MYAYAAAKRTGANALIARYGYDPLNRRLWKEQYRDANGQALAQAQRSVIKTYAGSHP